MAEKRFNSRIIHKHAVESDWVKATNFTPMQGEIIVYDKDETYSYERFKIGDGTTVVSSLPFADAHVLSEIDTLETSTNQQITTVSQAVLNVSSLVGDTSVAQQIANAQMIYVGPDMPTDPNIKVWINTAEEGTGIVPVLPRIATISLPAASWTGSSAPYSQVVEINTVTSATKIDLQPTVAQIVDLQNQDIALMAENVNGVVTIYSFGGKPSSDMTMQVQLMEVSYV